MEEKVSNKADIVCIRQNEHEVATKFSFVTKIW